MLIEATKAQKKIRTPNINKLIKEIITSNNLLLIGIIELLTNYIKLQYVLLKNQLSNFII